MRKAFGKTLVVLSLSFLACLTVYAQEQPRPATLSETLEWLVGATENESATGISPHSHYTFHNKGGNSCFVEIVETRVEAGPDWWDKESFSLSDIDPDDIHVEKLGSPTTPSLVGETSVSFHTTNYRKVIIDSSRGPFYPGGKALPEPVETPTARYSVITNDSFAPRFAKAFKRAVELCGGKRSAF